MKSKKIAVASYFGGDMLNALNTYSVVYRLKKAGAEPDVPDMPLDLSESGEEFPNKRAVSFLKENVNFIPSPKTKEETEELLSEYDTFISDASVIDLLDYKLLGSSGHYYLLDFVPNSKKKIVLGKGLRKKAVVPEEYRKEAEYYLENVNAVIDGSFNILSVPAEEWIKIADNAEIKKDIEKEFKKDTFVYSYIVNIDKDKLEKLKTITSESPRYVGCTINAELTDKEQDGLQLIDAEDIAEAVYLISKAEYVVTDSVSAVMLSVCLGRSFTFLADADNESDIAFAELLEEFNLGSHVIFSDSGNISGISLSEIGYDHINKYIDIIKSKSEKELTEALEEGEPSGTELRDIRFHLKPAKTVGLADFKIQNIILPAEDWQEEQQNLIYRGDKCEYDEAGRFWRFKKDGFSEFFTYLNSLSIRKWRRYTRAEKFFLHLKIKGSFAVSFFGHYMVTPLDKNKKKYEPLEDTIDKINSYGGNTIGFIFRAADRAEIKKEIYKEHTFDLKAPAEICIPVPEGKSSVTAFQIKFISDCIIYDGYYSAAVYENALNPVDISICSTTYKKEDFVINNAELIKKEIFLNTKTGGMEELSDHLFMNIVDNGRSEELSECNDYRIRVYENPNVGGAGGFTRGMLETLKLRDSNEFNATHVLFMDDDVVILPESIKRTYALLRLIKDEYKDHFISGAMLRLDEMNIQHEDSGFVTKYVNSTHPQKPCMDMSLWDNVLRNEENFRQKNNYSAWWYCCVPISVVRYDNLSVPLFFRGDDIEFSLRNKARNITMNGIAIWHMSFGKRFSAATDIYLSYRNLMFTQAVSGINEDIDFLARIKKHFFIEIRKFNYITCELLLDAVEDFMKGPDFFADSDSEAVMKEHAAKAKKDKYLPLAAFAELETDTSDAYRIEPLNDMDEKIFEDTYNGHTLPDYMLINDDYVPSVGFDWFESPAKQFLRPKILAVNANAGTAVLHEMDRKEFKRLMTRYEELMKSYDEEIEELRRNYRDNAERLHSREFWEGYLDSKLKK